jgi:hypothetical protein
MDKNLVLKIKEQLITIVDEADDKAAYYPIDRYYLENTGYLKKVLEFDSQLVVFCTLDLGNDLISEQFFLCIPELWEGIVVEDLLEMVNCFSNPFAVFSLIKFTHKVLEINIIEAVFEEIKKANQVDLCEQVKLYLLNQYNVLIQPKYTQQEIHEEEKLLGASFDVWRYQKQRLLLSSIASPAILDYGDLKEYVDSLFNKLQCHG